MSNNAPFMEHRVKPGDTLAKIAQAYYGDPRAYVKIAQANGLDPHRTLSEGVVLRIPTAQLGAAEDLEEIQVTAQRLPTSGASNAPVDPSTGVETVTVTASRLPPWATDWKTWALVAAGAWLLYNWLEENQ